MNEVPVAGETLEALQAKASALVPPLMPSPDNPERGFVVGLNKRNTIVFVAVGSGVSVFRGVGVTGVGVALGMAACVRVEAAKAVCMINVPMAFGSTVGTETAGTGRAGIHARTAASATHQIKYFDLIMVMASMAHQIAKTKLIIQF